METISLDIQNENINIEDALANISDTLKNNLQFKNQLRGVISHLAKNHSKVELFIEDDNNSFSFITRLGNNPDYNEELVKDNKFYEEVKFSTDQDENLIVEMSNGTAFNFSDYYDTFKLVDPSLSKLADNRPNNIIYLFRTYKVFDKDGIQTKYDYYADNVPCDLDINNYNEIMTVNTMRSISSKNRPNFNLSYKDDNFMNIYTNPYYLGIDRLPYNLSLADVTLIYGNKDNVHRSLKCVDTINPDLLKVSQIPFVDFDNGINVSIDYARNYPNMTKQEIERELAIKFNNDLENSNTKAYRNEIYDRIKERSDNELKERYTLIEESKERVM